MDSSTAFFHDLFMEKGSDVGVEIVALRAVIVFILAIVFVRVAKKRSIAQASAMDLALMIIFGSVMSRGVNGGANLISSLVAGLVLVLLQRALAFWGARNHRFGNLVKGTSQVIVQDGQLNREAMRRHAISEHDLLQEMRVRVLTDDISKIKQAVLERSGQIGFVKKAD